MHALKDGPSSTILVVEDEAFIRLDVADFLVEAGYRVIAEANADHALTVLQLRSDIAVLFTDVNMPGPLDGCALARVVAERWPGVGILVTSGKGDPIQGELPPHAVFLPKPYRLAAVLDMLGLMRDGREKQEAGS